jgi:hypothetical protein
MLLRQTLDKKKQDLKNAVPMKQQKIQDLVATIIQTIGRLKLISPKSSNGFNSFAKILVKPNSENLHRNLNRNNNFAIDAGKLELIFLIIIIIIRMIFLIKKSRIQFHITEGPGIGAYNADANYSLEYKIAKNCAKNSLVEAPFNCTKSRPRFEDERKMIPCVLGPRIYHKTETQKFKQICFAF